MNILILSVGTRNKIVQYFKRNIGDNGNVIVTDMQTVAPAIYEADGFYTVPRITEDGYIDIILDICKKEKINAVLSLIDPELSLLALNERRFSDIGVTVIGSPYEMCETAFDKMRMYRFLTENGYGAARSYTNIDEFYSDLENGLISFPVFVKPVRGSASIAISKVENREMLDLIMRTSDGLMIQEFVRGQEIGADVYIDMLTHEVVSIFTKKKLLMRAGETDKSVSFKDEKLFEYIEKFVKAAGFTGQIDIDIFDTDRGYIINEVNPRFGGGYPHAYECGVDHIKLICNNLCGIANEKNIGQYDDGIVMMKYGEVKIIRTEV